MKLSIISVCSHFSRAARDAGSAAGGSRHSVQNSTKDELLHFSLRALRSGDLLQISGIFYFLAGSYFILKFPTWKSGLGKLVFGHLNSILRLKKL